MDTQKAHTWMFYVLLDSSFTPVKGLAKMCTHFSSCPFCLMPKRQPYLGSVISVAPSG